MRRQMEVNFFGLLKVTQTFLPLLGASFDSPYPPGKLINVSSVSGRMTRMMMGPYSASKYALEAMSDALRRELSIFNIRVSIIEPGPIDTEIWEKAKKEDNPYMDTDYEYILKQRDKIIEQNQKMSISAEKVAEKIYHAVTSSKPKIRYLITGKKILILLIIKVLPTRWVDKLFTLMAKRK
jgi:short-subunit dehydrogenase